MKNQRRAAYFAWVADREKKTVLVRCRTMVDAIEEKDRLKTDPTARHVGYTPRQADELDVKHELESRGHRVVLIREQ